MRSIVFRCKTLGNIYSTPFDLGKLMTPRFAIPDLDVIPQSGDDDLTAELRVCEQRRRDHQAALFVELGLGRTGEEEALDLACFLAERIQRGESRLDESIPILTTVGLETPVDAFGDDEAFGEGFAKLGGKGETVLVIDRVLVRSEEHLRPGNLYHCSPLCPTLIHLSTPRTGYESGSCSRSRRRQWRSPAAATRGKATRRSRTGRGRRAQTRPGTCRCRASTTTSPATARSLHGRRQPRARRSWLSPDPAQRCRRFRRRRRARCRISPRSSRRSRGCRTIRYETRGTRSSTSETPTATGACARP